MPEGSATLAGAAIIGDTPPSTDARVGLPVVVTLGVHAKSFIASKRVCSVKKREMSTMKGGVSVEVVSLSWTETSSSQVQETLENG